MFTPLVSVLMPTLNAERTLEMALAALRRQTIGADAVEILIADGGSTDDTRAIALRYGAIILENERVLPEYGVAVAMAAARGRYALIMGSDEVITNEASLSIKVRLMSENPRVHNVIFGGLKNPKGYPPIGDYVNRCGDPFSYFMHRIDSGDHWNALRSRYRVVREESDYAVVQIGKDEPFPICDAHFFSLEHLRTVADVTDHTLIAHIFPTMAQVDRQLAVVRNDFTDHYSTAHYRTAKAKIEWRVVGNMHHAGLGMAGYANREEAQPRSFRWKKYLFLPYALSVAAPAVDAAILAVRCRAPGMLYHLPLTVGTGLSILKHGALKVLGIKPAQRVYGK
jgi:glycosyltransferase involved in cell wall biosynthesis